MNPLRTLFLAMALTVFHGLSAFADTQSKRPLCIVTENGWTLGIWQNGSSVLLRTGKPSIRVCAIPGAFDYYKLVDATDIACRKCPLPPTRLKYFYGYFDKPEVHPLPESPVFYRLLSHAQTIFDGCKNQSLLNLLRKYPLQIE